MTTQPKDRQPTTPPKAVRDIRPVKAIVTVVYGEYKDGELVNEFPTEQRILYRHQFSTLATTAEQSIPEVRKAIDAQQNGSGPNA